MPKCLLCRRDEHSAAGNKGLITGFRVCGSQITSALVQSQRKKEASVSTGPRRAAH